MHILSQKVDELKILLKNSQHIRIITHRNPDGDALGSMLAFAYICESFQINYDMFILDEIPGNLLFLPGIDKIIQYETIKEDEELYLNEKTDLVVFVDCGQLNRSGILSDMLLPHQKIVNIDHHISNTYFGHLNYVADISSTCELLFHIIGELGLDISQDLAEILYIGILTDTGCFQYDKTTAITLEVVSKLLLVGVNPYKIYIHIYQSYPTSWLSLLKQGLNKIELYHNDSLAMIAFSQDDFIDGFDEITVFLPIISATASIEVYVLLKEKEDQSISVSLRSKSNRIDVSKIAEVFGGGGHQKAAGCRTNIHLLHEFKEMIKFEILKHL
ncbi:MAG: DHH family phosphoesterase [Brevinema sp.]